MSSCFLFVRFFHTFFSFPVFIGEDRYPIVPGFVALTTTSAIFLLRIRTSKLLEYMYIYLRCSLSSLYTYVFSLFDFRNHRRWCLLVGPTHDDDRVCLVFRWEGGGVVGDFFGESGGCFFGCVNRRSLPPCAHGDCRVFVALDECMARALLS